MRDASSASPAAVASPATAAPPWHDRHATAAPAEAMPPLHPIATATEAAAATGAASTRLTHWIRQLGHPLSEVRGRAWANLVAKREAGLVTDRAVVREPALLPSVLDGWAHDVAAQQWPQLAAGLAAVVDVLCGAGPRLATGWLDAAARAQLDALQAAVPQDQPPLHSRIQQIRDLAEGHGPPLTASNAILPPSSSPPSAVAASLPPASSHHAPWPTMPHAHSHSRPRSPEPTGAAARGHPLRKPSAGAASRPDDVWPRAWPAPASSTAAAAAEPRHAHAASVPPPPLRPRYALDVARHRATMTWMALPNLVPLTVPVLLSARDRAFLAETWVALRAALPPPSPDASQYADDDVEALSDIDAGGDGDHGAREGAADPSARRRRARADADLALHRLHAEYPPQVFLQSAGLLEALLAHVVSHDPRTVTWGLRHLTRWIHAVAPLLHERFHAADGAVPSWTDGAMPATDADTDAATAWPTSTASGLTVLPAMPPVDAERTTGAGISLPYAAFEIWRALTPLITHPVYHAHVLLLMNTLLPLLLTQLRGALTYHADRRAADPVEARRFDSGPHSHDALPHGVDGDRDDAPRRPTVGDLLDVYLAPLHHAQAVLLRCQQTAHAAQVAETLATWIMRHRHVVPAFDDDAVALHVCLTASTTPVLARSLVDVMLSPSCVTPASAARLTRLLRAGHAAFHGGDGSSGGDGSAVSIHGPHRRSAHPALAHAINWSFLSYAARDAVLDRQVHAASLRQRAGRGRRRRNAGLPDRDGVGDDGHGDDDGALGAAASQRGDPLDELPRSLALTLLACVVSQTPHRMNGARAMATQSRLAPLDVLLVLQPWWPLTASWMRDLAARVARPTSAHAVTCPSPDDLKTWVLQLRGLFHADRSCRDAAADQLRAWRCAEDAEVAWDADVYASYAERGAAHAALPPTAAVALGGSTGTARWSGSALTDAVHRLVDAFGAAHHAYPDLAAIQAVLNQLRRQLQDRAQCVKALDAGLLGSLGVLLRQMAMLRSLDLRQNPETDWTSAVKDAVALFYRLALAARGRHAPASPPPPPSPSASSIAATTAMAATAPPRALLADVDGNVLVALASFTGVTSARPDLVRLLHVLLFPTRPVSMAPADAWRRWRRGDAHDPAFADSDCDGDVAAPPAAAAASVAAATPEGDDDPFGDPFDDDGTTEVDAPYDIPCDARHAYLTPPGLDDPHDGDGLALASSAAPVSVAQLWPPMPALDLWCRSLPTVLRVVPDGDGVRRDRDGDGPSHAPCVNRAEMALRVLQAMATASSAAAFHDAYARWRHLFLSPTAPAAWRTMASPRQQSAFATARARIVARYLFNEPATPSDREILACVLHFERDWASADLASAQDAVSAAADAHGSPWTADVAARALQACLLPLLLDSLAAYSTDDGRSDGDPGEGDGEGDGEAAAVAPDPATSLRGRLLAAVALQIQIAAARQTLDVLVAQTPLVAVLVRVVVSCLMLPATAAAAEPMDGADGADNAAATPHHSLPRPIAMAHQYAHGVVALRSLLQCYTIAAVAAATAATPSGVLEALDRDGLRRRDGLRSNPVAQHMRDRMLQQTQTPYPSLVTALVALVASMPTAGVRHQPLRHVCMLLLQTMAVYAARRTPSSHVTHPAGKDAGDDDGNRFRHTRSVSLPATPWWGPHWYGTAAPLAWLQPLLLPTVDGATDADADADWAENEPACHEARVDAWSLFSHLVALPSALSDLADVMPQYLDIALGCVLGTAFPTAPSRGRAGAAGSQRPDPYWMHLNVRHHALTVVWHTMNTFLPPAADNGGLRRSSSRSYGDRGCPSAEPWRYRVREWFVLLHRHQFFARLPGLLRHLDAHLTATPDVAVAYPLMLALLVRRLSHLRGDVAVRLDPEGAPVRETDAASAIDAVWPLTAEMMDALLSAAASALTVPAFVVVPATSTEAPAPAASLAQRQYLDHVACSQLASGCHILGALLALVQSDPMCLQVETVAFRHHWTRLWHALASWSQLDVLVSASPSSARSLALSTPTLSSPARPAAVAAIIAQWYSAGHALTALGCVVHAIDPSHFVRLVTPTALREVIDAVTAGLVAQTAATAATTDPAVLGAWLRRLIDAVHRGLPADEAEDADADVTRPARTASARSIAADPLAVRDLFTQTAAPLHDALRQLLDRDTPSSRPQLPRSMSRNRSQSRPVVRSPAVAGAATPWEVVAMLADVLGAAGQTSWLWVRYAVLSGHLRLWADWLVSRAQAESHADARADETAATATAGSNPSLGYEHAWCRVMALVEHTLATLQHACREQPRRRGLSDAEATSAPRHAQTDGEANTDALGLLRTACLALLDADFVAPCMAPLAVAAGSSAAAHPATTTTPPWSSASVSAPSAAAAVVSHAALSVSMLRAPSPSTPSPSPRHAAAAWPPRAADGIAGLLRLLDAARVLAADADDADPLDRLRQRLAAPTLAPRLPLTPHRVLVHTLTRSLAGSLHATSAAAAAARPEHLHHTLLLLELAGGMLRHAAWHAALQRSGMMAAILQVVLPTPPSAAAAAAGPAPSAAMAASLSTTARVHDPPAAWPPALVRGAWIVVAAAAATTTTTAATAPSVGVTDAGASGGGSVSPTPSVAGAAAKPPLAGGTAAPALPPFLAVVAPPGARGRDPASTDLAVQALLDLRDPRHGPALRLAAGAALAQMLLHRDVRSRLLHARIPPLVVHGRRGVGVGGVSGGYARSADDSVWGVLMALWPTTAALQPHLAASPSDATAAMAPWPLRLVDLLAVLVWHLIYASAPAKSRWRAASELVTRVESLSRVLDDLLPDIGDTDNDNDSDSGDSNDDDDGVRRADPASPPAAAAAAAPGIEAPRAVVLARLQRSLRHIRQLACHVQP
ncbi:hypothetical protein CXG81DRAFT_17647 [Caulochytrium protostelioides]|uniref:Uncharacterized protein n=1 Tax=Caulochytrium protostelioides TaxID=1555241 RepID=A0A4P9XBB8_9FUNG|nr:hypothetical protein CXG81DRAFT_17647 [Caulochytrium protostelioides]|eukprot:RKP02676.1 hypothetical protein CXG81DRAFT_17647 [Caulochytrium protostelioides]